MGQGSICYYVIGRNIIETDYSILKYFMQKYVTSLDKKTDLWIGAKLIIINDSTLRA